MKPHVLDATDRALIGLLKADARASITYISQMLGVSRTTAQKRLDMLRSRGVIRRFTVELSEPGNDDLIHAITMIELQGIKADQVKRHLAKMTEVTSVYSTNGKWGMIANIEAQNLGHFDRVLARIERIPGLLSAETCILLSRL